jgi:hypothetical protein
MVAPLTVGAGWTVGPGWRIGPKISTAGAQNVSGGPANPGFFFAVLNRSIQGWDYFAANGNNGTWTATGDFGSGAETIPVVSVTNDADSVFPVVATGVYFQSGGFYSFTGD